MLIVEIRDNSLALFDIEIRTKKNILKKFIEIEISDNWKNFISNKKNIDELADLFRDYSFVEAKVELCMNISAIIYRDLTVPKTSPKFLTSLIRNELVNSLNLTPEYLIDYAIIGEVEKDEISYHKVLVSAIQESVLREYLIVFMQLNLKVDRVSVGLSSLIRYLEVTTVIEKDKSLLAVDIGAQSIRQFLFVDGQYSYFRNTKLISDTVTNTAPTSAEYAKQIEKMFQFAFAQGHKQEINLVLLFGNQLLIDELSTYLNEVKEITTTQLDSTKLIDYKYVPFNSDLIYVIGSFFANRYKRKKDIELLAQYNSYNKIKKYALDPKALFRPTAILVSLFLMFFTTFQISQATLLSNDIRIVQRYLNDPTVVAKMEEITSKRIKIAKINAIKSELDSIQKVLVSIPHLKSESIDALYSVKPATIMINKIGYANRMVTLDLTSVDSTSFHRYAIALSSLSYFEQVNYVNYRAESGSNIYSTEITLLLKGDN